MKKDIIVFLTGMLFGILIVFTVYKLNDLNVRVMKAEGSIKEIADFLNKQITQAQKGVKE